MYDHSSKNADEQGGSESHFPDLIITFRPGLTRLTKPCPFKVLFVMHVVRRGKILRIPTCRTDVGPFYSQVNGNGDPFCIQNGIHNVHPTTSGLSSWTDRVAMQIAQSVLSQRLGYIRYMNKNVSGNKKSSTTLYGKIHKITNYYHTALSPDLYLQREAYYFASNRGN
jgi:hypothetical protein